MNSKQIITDNKAANIVSEHPEKAVKQEKQAERDQIRSRRRYFEQLRERKELNAIIRDSLDDIDI